MLDDPTPKTVVYLNYHKIIIIFHFQLIANNTRMTKQLTQ